MVDGPESVSDEASAEPSAAEPSAAEPSAAEPSDEQRSGEEDSSPGPPFMREIRPEFHQVYAQLYGHATCQLDQNGTTIQVNPVMPRLLGVAPEKLTGRRFLDFFRGADRDRIAPLLEDPPDVPKHLEGMEILGGGEKAVSVDLTVVPVHEKRAGSTGIFLMIHNREQPPATVDDSYIYRKIMDQVVDSVIMTDPEGSLLFWNSAAERLFGWKRDEIIGRNALRLVFLSDDPTTEKIAGRIQYGNTWKGDCLMRRKHGDVFLADFQGGPILGYDRSVIGMFVVCRDRPSDLIDREMEWKRTRMPWSGGLHGRSLDRDRLIHEGVQEVRNPLTAMRIHLDLMKRALPKEHSQHIDRSLKAMEQSLGRTTQVLEKILDMARIERHQIQLDPDTVYLDDLLMQIRHDLRQVARDAGVSMHIDVDSNIFMYGDARRLSQVLAAIMSNGLKFSRSGGYVRVTAMEKQEELEIQIQDNGIGLSPDEIDRIFQPFTRIESEGKRSGTGLSLYIAKGIVEAHGGKLLVDSPGRDKGARFTIILPTKRSVHAIPSN